MLESPSNHIVCPSVCLTILCCNAITQKAVNLETSYSKHRWEEDTYRLWGPKFKAYSYRHILPQQQFLALRLDTSCTDGGLKKKDIYRFWLQKVLSQSHTDVMTCTWLYKCVRLYGCMIFKVYMWWLFVSPVDAFTVYSIYVYFYKVPF